jgi:hypothetical protein
MNRGMTEAEWLACTDPELLLMWLEGRIRPRKLRLFGCACCRRLWGLLPDERGRNAVVTAELFADGLVGEEALTSAARDAGAVSQRLLGAAGAAAGAADEVTWGPDEFGGVYHTRLLLANGAYARGEREKVAQCQLLRDIVGNPFRPAALGPAWAGWSDRTIPKLAQAIYEERAFDRLPLLADALEDAGCADAGLLGHLRGPGPHVRGCWAVDLLLGQE